MYWKEYLPFMLTWEKRSPVERIMKYSLSAVQSSMRMPRTDQPNSGDRMSQPRMVTSATFPQGLDAVQAGALDGDMVGIPQRRPAKPGHFAVPDGQAMVMPEG